MENLTTVAATTGPDAAIAAALPNVQQYLQNIAGSSGYSASALAQYLPQLQQFLASKGTSADALAQLAGVTN